MPVPIKVRDNTNTIKVDVKETDSVVHVKDKSNSTIQPIKVKDNSKDIKIKVNDESSEVSLDYDCGIKEKVLDNKITKEKEERIAADNQEREERISADEELERQIREIIVGGVSVDETNITFNDNNALSVTPQLQEKINNKQDIIQFVNIDSESGTLTESQLKLLRDNNINRLTYNNVIYYMSLKDGNVKKYFSRATGVELNEIDLNITTGNYAVISSIDAALQRHIDDKVIHVSQEDRDRWDNKVSAQAELIKDDNYLLKLSTD